MVEIFAKSKANKYDIPLMIVDTSLSPVCMDEC